MVTFWRAEWNPPTTTTPPPPPPPFFLRTQIPSEKSTRAEPRRQPHDSRRWVKLIPEQQCPPALRKSDSCSEPMSRSLFLGFHLQGKHSRTRQTHSDRSTFHHTFSSVTSQVPSLSVCLSVLLSLLLSLPPLPTLSR